MQELTTKITELWALPGVREATIICLGACAALIVRLGFERVMTRLTARTRTSEAGTGGGHSIRSHWPGAGHGAAHRDRSGQVGQVWRHPAAGGPQRCCRGG